MSATVSCPNCAASIDGSATFCPKCGAARPASRAGAPVRRTFGSSIGICFANYVGFAGRAPRAEYWYFGLFNFLCQIGAEIVAVAMLGSSGASGLRALVALALFLPSLAVTVRRLHDIDRSGWWVLIALVPVAGAILLLVWFCTRGVRGPNRFGEDELPADA